MAFVYFHVFWFTTWVLLNLRIGGFPAFDPFPYRNDRLVAVANDAHNFRELRSINDVSKNLLDELVISLSRTTK